MTQFGSACAGRAGTAELMYVYLLTLSSFISSGEKSIMIEDALLDIIREEANDYFNGTVSAEDAARSIQFKVEIYISERS